MEPAHEAAPALPATPCLPPSPPQPLQQLQLPAIEIPCCSICLAEYAPGIRKPYDLGCGHCVCGRCFASLSMTGPKTCPVDRKEWVHPHVAYELLHLVEQLHTQQQKQQQQHEDAGAAGRDGAAVEAVIPAAFLLGQQDGPGRSGSRRRRWRPPDPFRPVADTSLLLSDLWRAALWPPASDAELLVGGGGDVMGLRELAGHLAAAAPDWAHTAWRVVAPGAAVMAALLGWRYIAAVAMLVLPLTLAAAAGLEMRNKSWPMMTACAAAGVLGSLAPVAPLLGAGLLQQLLGVGLLAFLVGAMMHSRHCDCLLSRIMRRRLVQAAVTCAAGALFVSGLRRSLRLRLAARLGLAHIALGLFQALRVVHWWGVRWEILPEWPLGPIGVEPPSFRPLWAVATGSADGSGVGHVGMGAGGVDEIIVAVVAAAEAAERPPPGHLSMLLLAARCLLTPILFMWTSVLVEGYRGSLTEGGAASLSAGLARSPLATGSSQSYYGIGAPFASPCRFDLDWVVLRGVVWVGVMCATGSWRIASGANVALHGAFSLLRLLAANSRLKQLFRNESSAAATAAILAAAAREQAAALTAASMAEAARRRQQAQASQALQAQRQRPSGQRSGAAAAAGNAGIGSSAGHRPRGSRRAAAQMIAGVASSAAASPVPTPAPLAAPAPPIAPTPAIPPPPAPIYSHVPRPRPAPPNKMLDRLREKYEVQRQPVPPHRAGFANPGRGRGGGRGSAQLAAGGGALGAASGAGVQASAGVEREEEGRRLVRQVVQRVVARVTGATGPSAALGSPRAAAATSLPAAAPTTAVFGAAAAAAAPAAAAAAPGGQAMPATPAAAPQSWAEARPAEAEPQPQPQPQDRNQSHQPQAAGPQAPLPAQAWYGGALTPSEAEDYMRRQVAFLVKEIFFRVNLRAGPQEVQMTGDLARGACRTDSTEDRIRNSCSRSRDLQLHVLPRKSRDERPEEEGESARAQPVAAAAAAAADSLVPGAAAAVGARAPAEPSAADSAAAATAAAAAGAGSAAGGGVAADLGMASGAGAAAGASASPSAAAASAAAAGGPVVGDGPQLQPPGPQAAQCIVQGARREAEAAAAAAQDRPSGTHTLPPEPEPAASRADGAEVNAAAEGEELQRCTLDSVRQARQRPEAATDAASSQRPPLAAAELVASPAGPAPPAAAAASAAASAVAAPGADDPRWADLWLQQQQQRRQQQQQQQQQQTQQELLPGEAGASPAAAGASGMQPTVAAARHVPSAAAGAASAGGGAGGATPAAPATSTPGLSLNLSGGLVFQAGVVGSGSGGGSAAPGTSAAGAGGAAAPAPAPHPRPSTRHAGSGSGNTTTGSTASTTGRRSAGSTSANASSNAGSGAAGRGGGGATGTSGTAAGTSGSGAANTTSGLARVSLMASSGPPRGGAFDDVLLAFSALVVVQWLALMPPWAQLLRLALWPLQGWMGPAGPMERALLWGSAVVLFGICVLVARVPTPRLQGLLRPCSGGSSGSGSDAVASADVLALMRFNAGMYAVPLVLRLLRQVWAPLPWLYLAGLTNLELLLRAIVLGLQSVGFMRHLPLSGPPPLPLAGALLFRCDPPAWTRARAVSYSRLVSIEYGLVRPEVRASRRAAAAAGAIILGLDDAISEWLGMCVEGAAALMTALYTIRSRAATAASGGAGDGAGGVAAAAAVAGAVSATVGSAGASRRTSGTGGVRVISTTGGSVRLGRAAPGSAAGPGGATVGVVGSGVAGLSAAETEAVVGAMLEQIRSRQSGGGGGGGAGGTQGASSSRAGAGGGAANGGAGAGAGGNGAGGGTLLRHVFPRNALDSDASERGARPVEAGEGDSDDDDDDDALKFYSDPDDDDDEDGSVWEEDEDEDEDEDGEEGRRGARGEGVTLVAPWSAYPSQAAGLTRRRVRVRRSERTSG